MKIIKQLTTFLFTFILLANIANALEPICFSPSKCCENNVIELIDNAENEINIAIFTFTNKHILNAIKKARARGINIKVVYDTRQSKVKGSVIQDLYKLNIEAYRNTKHKMEHNKFIIVDNRYLLTGSYNYTKAATKSNSENCVLITDDIYVHAFKQRFDYLFNLYKNTQ